MLLGTLYIQEETEHTRSQEKAKEGRRTKREHMETYGSLWKTREQSISKYVSDGQSGPESWTESVKAATSLDSTTCTKSSSGGELSNK